MTEGLAQDTAREGLGLFLTTVVAFSVQGISTILLARLLLPEGWGIYSIALLPIALLAPLRDMGMPLAAQYRVAKMPDTSNSTAVRKTALLGILWQTMVGFVLALLLFCSSGLISTWLGIPGLHLIIAASVPVLAVGGIYTVVYNLQIGFNNARAAGLLQVVFSVLKGGISLLLVSIGFGPTGAMLGFTAASLLVVVISLATIARLNHDEEAGSEVSNLQELRELLRYATPLGISEFTVATMNQIVLFIGAFYISTTEFGYFSVASTLASYIFAVFYPVVLVLLSAFAKLPSDSDVLESAYDRVTHMSALFIGVPCFIGIFLASPVIIILFGMTYAQSALLFSVFCFSDVVLTPLGKYSSGSLLLARGYSKDFSLVNVVTMIVILPAAAVLIPALGPIGVVVAIAGGRFVSILGYGLQVKRRMGISFIRMKSLRVLLALITCLALGLAASLLTIEMHWVTQTMLVTLLILPAVPISLKITGGLVPDDLKFIRGMANDIPVLGRAINTLVFMLERLFGPI